MPAVDSGPLAGFYLPDHDGGSILNLMASLVSGRGGTSPHRPLHHLAIERVAEARHVVYLLVDGLGERQLERYVGERGLGGRFFGKHPFEPISTVFPATTAAAVTTFATGASPLEHGVLGWYLHLPDLGVVSTILLLLAFALAIVYRLVLLVL